MFSSALRVSDIPHSQGMILVQRFGHTLNFIYVDMVRKCLCFPTELFHLEAAQVSQYTLIYPLFCATIFFTFQAQSHFKQAAVV